MNMHRRHLTPSQRSTAGAKIANMRVGNFSKSNSARLPISPVSQAQAAKMVGVSTSMVTAAAKVAREAPELVPRIEKGEMTVHGEMRHYPVGNRSSATGAAGCGLPCARPGRCVVRGDPPSGGASGREPSRLARDRARDRRPAHGPSCRCRPLSSREPSRPCGPRAPCISLVEPGRL